MAKPTDGAFETVQVHFDDLDPMGMLHNVRYGLLVDRALFSYWLREGWHPDPNRSAFPDVARATKSLVINYHQPIAGPGNYLVHWWIDRLGRTSDQCGFDILSADRSVLHADGHRVHVNLDPQTGQPTPLSDKLRKAAEALLVDAQPHE